MIEGVIGVVCTLIIYFLKRKLSYEQDKNAQLEDKLQETAEAIVEGDEELLNANLDTIIKRLQIEAGNHSKRQGSSKNEEG
jgi:ABC-type siderophore export system fused ATPase/permease subunit